MTAPLANKAHFVLGRRPLLRFAGLAAAAAAFAGYSRWARFPSDQTPNGAYLRIVQAVNRDTPEEFFAYIEEAAQHACFTIRDYRAKALAVAQASYPAEKMRELRDEYEELASAPDGANVFGKFARDEGWLEQLRQDISGIASVEVEGERATVITARGTRYAMRRRPNGIWGLTAFTPLLVTEAERAARDLALIEKAAADHARVGATR